MDKTLNKHTPPGKPFEQDIPDTGLAGYSAASDRYDEMFAAPRQPREHWQPFHRQLLATSSRELNLRITGAERHIRDSGVTYNVYNDAEGLDRQWELDVLPLVIPAEEWQQLESGIAQRARLLDLIMADLYGSQNLIKEGLLPASLVFGHSSFIRNSHGMHAAGGHFLHLYAADLARSPDGQWWVLADRTQAPSGAGYALENRLIVSQVFPELFRNMEVRHLAQYFAAMRDSLMHHAPRGDGATLAVVLTPGPFNETYFEHAFLARYLGFRLVEGSDLIVSDNKVWLKTIEGRLRVHVILRRQDDSFCDPLELRVDSTLGVAGLMQCVRSGSVLVANPPGSGIVEAGALMGFLPRLCEALLDEPLRLPSIATWWCGEKAAMQDAFKRYQHLVFKPADRNFGFEPIFGNDLSTSRFRQLKMQILKHPERYVAQELVHMSQAPILTARSRQKFKPRGIGLRVHASLSMRGDYVVMPGGLTRVAAQEDSPIVSMQRGGSSKDTWVLADGPLDTQFTLLRSTLAEADLVHGNIAITSRVAETEFWFGRNSERCESIARLLRCALTAILQESEDGTSSPVFGMARSWSLITEGHNIEHQLLGAATSGKAPFGLVSNLRSLSHLGYQLRDRLSMDHWRSLNQLLHNQIIDRHANLDQALAWIDTIILGMTTLSGFALDGMNRDSGFRFLSIGRRLERMSFLTRALNIAMLEGRNHGLTWLLELCDSVITYRSRYMSQPEWLPVMDLLIRDRANPRALLFQVLGIQDYLRKMEERHGPCGREELDAGLAMIEKLDPDSDFHPDSEKLLEAINTLHAACYKLSDRLTIQFFNHPGSQGEWSSSWL
jgi:uncharacterized circularly permuted ATP-grasp superfamily protein/uncharacterized alpha-E superfamily protein